MVENLNIGTRSWTSKAWQSFFPKDLPIDWQLDYYSHYFNCALVPNDQWLTWSESEILEFAEALEGEAFEFFFELKGRFTPKVNKQLALIQSHFAVMAVGIVLEGEAQVLPSELNAYHLTLISEKQSLSGWHWQYNDQVCSGYPIGIVSDLPADGKAQSACLQSFMDSLPADFEKANFIVRDDAISIETVQNLKIIAEVMGF